jgi:hypothetical protein
MTEDDQPSVTEGGWTNVENKVVKPSKEKSGYRPGVTQTPKPKPNAT